MRLTLLLFVLVLSHLPTAQGDTIDHHFDLICKTAKNRAEIIPYAVWNTDVYSAAPQDCTLANGRTIRAKMGLGPVYPYGAGGASPSKWLSVWVDKARVLSRLHFGCGDEGPCSLRVVVAAAGVEVCRPGKSNESSPRDSQRAPKDQCEFTPNEKLSKERDVLEFPLPHEKAPPSPGSLVTLYAKDEQFCDQFRLLSKLRGRPSVGDNIRPRVGLPNDSEQIEPVRSSSYEYAGGYQHYIFDINNDGKNETVVGLHSRTHYRDGDIYFVYASAEVPNPPVTRVGSTRSELVYAKAAARILPHFWSDYAGGDEQRFAEKNIDTGAYLLKRATAPWWDAKDKPIFRFRYWYLWPFRYKESTYFLTWSMEGAKRHWYIVLHPEPDFRATEMCAFQVVQVRY